MDREVSEEAKEEVEDPIVEREVPESAIAIARAVLSRCSTVVRVGIGRGFVWERRLMHHPVGVEGISSRTRATLSDGSSFVLIDEDESREVQMPFFMGTPFSPTT